MRKLKVGDKAMVNEDAYKFKKGQIVEVVALFDDGIHFVKGKEVAGYLAENYYTLIPSGHPHADLMLKYAMIAQYDDKPWEHFEHQIGAVWYPMTNTSFYEGFKYRLKPQPLTIKAGQIWVSKEGVEVMVDTPTDEDTVFFIFNLGWITYRNSFDINYFLSNFKRKDK